MNGLGRSPTAGMISHCSRSAPLGRLFPSLLLPLLLLGACSDDANEGAGDNERPVVTPLTAETDEDTLVVIDVLAGASDPDGDQLFVRTATAGSHTVVVKGAGKVSLTPAPNFHGTIELLYEVSDTHFDTPGKVAVTVRPVNDAPLALPESAALLEDTPRALTLTGSDAESDALTFVVVTPPLHGTLSGTPPMLTYTPEANFFGEDTLRYEVSDGTLASAPATLRLLVANVNDAPIATAKAITVDEDVAYAFSLGATDLDGDRLTYTLVSPPSHGTLVGAEDNRIYLASANYHGPDEVTYSVSDGKASSQNVTVSITVSPVDDVPTVQSLFPLGTEDTALAVTLRGNDADGDALTYAIATAPQHGSLTGTGASLTYTPAQDYFGNDTFTYTATGAGVTSAPATVSVSLAAVNDAPVAVNATVTTLEEAQVAITLQATDVDSAALSYAILSRPSDGFLTGSGANRTYVPSANATGLRTLQFSVFDASSSATGTVTIDITPVNDAPVAVVDFVSTSVNEALEIPVLGNDVDVDGDVLTIESTTEPAHGEVAIVASQLVYTPDDGYVGNDQLSYTLIDAAGVTATSSVTVGVGEFPAGAPKETLAFAGASGSFFSDGVLSISQDGRVVVFLSKLRLVPQDTNDLEDVYVYDRGRRKLRRASETAEGVAANRGSYSPHLSGNGRFVVFESLATNLVPGDAADVSDVFRKDLVTGALLRLSVDSAGVAGNGDSYQPRISDDGDRVVFTSVAFNLAGSDSNGTEDIFLRDIAAGTTQRMSVSLSGGESDLESYDPAISGDGRHVAFTSMASNLVAGDQNERGDIFVRDLTAGATGRVSVSTNGVEGDENSGSPSLSRDGRFVSFSSFATNLVPNGGIRDAYVRDREAGITTRAVATVEGWPQLSGDGRHLCGVVGTAVFLYDRFSAFYTPFTPPSNARWESPAFSGNGRYVVFIESSTGAIIVVPNPR